MLFEVAFDYAWTLAAGYFRCTPDDGHSHGPMKIGFLIFAAVDHNGNLRIGGQVCKFARGFGCNEVKVLQLIRNVEGNQTGIGLVIPLGA